MARRKTNPIEKTATKLAGGKPIDVHQRADGTLVVIGPLGRKLTFTPEEVSQAQGEDKNTESGGEEAT